MIKERKAPSIIAFTAVLTAVLVVMSVLGIKFFRQSRPVQIESNDDGVSFSEISAQKVTSTTPEPGVLAFTDNFEADDSEEEEAVIATAVTEVEYVENVDVAAKVKEYYSSWATTGDMIYSRNVSNVLFVVGAKDRASDDIFMLGSISKTSRAITLTPLFRNSYVCVTVNGTKVYNTLNAIYKTYGMSALVKAVSESYKIKIDNYAAFSFSALCNMVDDLGGVYVSDSTRIYGNDVLGYIGSSYVSNEASQLKRQVKLVAGVLKKTKSLSVTNLKTVGLNLYAKLETDITKSDFETLAVKVVAEGWKNYTITGNSSSVLSYCIKVSGFDVSTGTADVYIIDYRYAARAVQNAVYGTTNVSIPAGYKPVTKYFG